jgi:hypothetical protein
MSEKLYFENIFVAFYEKLSYPHDAEFSDEDSKAAMNFYSIISSGGQLTYAQGKYIIQLLKKYHLLAKTQGVFYDKSLTEFSWKNSFRVLDTTKRVWVEEDDEKLWICFKFPYNLKEELEKEFLNSEFNRYSKYDYDKKVRKLDPYRFNILQINDFVEKFQISKDESFVNLVGQVEEIWQQENQLVPRSKIVNGKLVLINSTESAETYFSENKQNNIMKDMFLSKSMGFPLLLDQPTNDLVEKICSSSETTFWINELSKFFEIQKQIDDTSVIVLDRNTKDILDWLKNFLDLADRFNIPRTDIKVCFRDTETAGTDLNQWIKNEGLGGKVKDGKIFIFLHKPAKWLFKEKIDVKLVLTNSFIPVNEPITAKWLKTHYCNVILSEIKPTESKDKRIVEL